MLKSAQGEYLSGIINKDGGKSSCATRVTNLPKGAVMVKFDILHAENLVSPQAIDVRSSTSSARLGYVVLTAIVTVLVNSTDDDIVLSLKEDVHEGIELERAKFTVKFAGESPQSSLQVNHPVKRAKSCNSGKNSHVLMHECTKACTHAYIQTT